MIDAQEGVTEQDTKIAGLILDAGKAVVVAVNKWDLVEKDTHTMAKMEKEVLRDLKFMSYVPILFLSALTGKRVHTVLGKVKEVVGKLPPPYSDGRFERSARGCADEPPAAHTRRPEAENLLRDAAVRMPADLCVLYQRQRAHALRL